MSSDKKKVLHDPIAYKERVVDIQFMAPRKERTTTGRYMPAGSYYGTGFRTPVGKESAKGMKSGPIPQDACAFYPEEAIR